MPKSAIKYLLLFILLTSKFYTQDSINFKSISYTLIDIEKIFLTKNYQLLAAKYNIDAQKAAIIQAKLYPNPNISYIGGAFKPSYIHYPEKVAEQMVNVSQIIRLAGKRRKEIQMAKTNAILAEDQFLDLLRTLKYTLRSDFFSIYYLQQTAKVYDEAIIALKKVVDAGEIQLQKGFISKREYLNNKATLYSLQSEYNDLKNQINDKQSELRILLDTTGIYITPNIESFNIDNISPKQYSYNTFVDSAFKNRGDLLIAQHNFLLNIQNLSYQKSLSVPDITALYAFDSHGNAWDYQHAFGFAIDLPFFDRNQGNIKVAKYLVKQYNALLQDTKIQVKESIFHSYQQALFQYQMYTSFDKNFLKEIGTLSKDVLDQYIKRTINMTEFLTFYSAYKDNVVQLNLILSNLMNAYIGIDFATGTDFFIKTK